MVLARLSRASQSRLGSPRGTRNPVRPNIATVLDRAPGKTARTVSPTLGNGPSPASPTAARGPSLGPPNRPKTPVLWEKSGQGGIRTRGRGCPLRRFSKPVPSATRPPVPGWRHLCSAASARQPHGRDLVQTGAHPSFSPASTAVSRRSRDRVEGCPARVGGVRAPPAARRLGSARVIPRDRDGDRLYFVQIGRFDSRQEAARVRDRIGHREYIVTAALQ